MKKKEETEVRYQIRSRDLIGLYNEIKAKRLIPNAYFQRNLVWRELHKKELIRTIMMKLPFPMIFISKGEIDVESMETVSCIVDGQQRLNAITSFIECEFDVDGKKFSDFTNDEKSSFFKYEIATIELDIDNNDPRIKEIFKRLNKTSNSLSNIENWASEYGATEFMLLGKYFVGEFEDSDFEDEYSFRLDPNIPAEFKKWVKNNSYNEFQIIAGSEMIFSGREIIRKVNLFYCLNMMATYVSGSFFNRNERTLEFLDSYAFQFNKRNEVAKVFNDVAEVFNSFDFDDSSMWYTKSNFYSLFMALCMSYKNLSKIDLKKVEEELAKFEKKIPSEYALAAKEGVNNKKERIIRHNAIVKILEKCIKAKKSKK